MVNTLITRITKLEQYNESEKTVSWKDEKKSRWKNVYGLLVKNDNAIFIAKGKILLGLVTQVNKGNSIFCNEVQELALKNDDFLRLHEIYPELITQVKANFQPFIHPQKIDLTQLNDAISNKRFINFYIFSSRAIFDKNKNNLKENDRVVLLNEKRELENIKLYTEVGLIDFPPDQNINIGVSGLTIEQVLVKNKEFKRKSLKLKKVSNYMIANGPFDFFGSYPKLRYRNIRGYLVGKLSVN